MEPHTHCYHLGSSVRYLDVARYHSGRAAHVRGGHAHDRALK
jgi:hypothetical protein